MGKPIHNHPSDDGENADDLVRRIREENFSNRTKHRRPNSPLPASKDRVHELTEYYTKHVGLEITISKDMDKFGDRWGIAGRRKKPTKKYFFKKIIFVELFDDLDTDRKYYVDLLIKFRDEE